MAASDEDIARDLVIALLGATTVARDSDGAKDGEWLGDVYAAALKKVRAATSEPPEPRPRR